MSKILAVQDFKAIELYAHTSPHAFWRNPDDMARAPQRGQVRIYRVRYVQHNVEYRADTYGVLDFKKYSHLRNILGLRGVL